MGGLAVVLCPACGEPTAAGDRFCEACGHALVAAIDDGVAGEITAGPPAAPACPSCGTEDPWLDGWCSVCGARQPDPRDHLEVALPGMAAVTDRGRRHHRNEDAMALGQGPGFVAAVVCDGVSQSQRPHDASQAAADAALGVLLATDPTAPDRVPRLAAAYRAARDAVVAIPYDATAALGPPSCTFLAALATADRVTLAALGDCRSYWVAGGEARQLTADHGWAAEAMAGGVGREEAMADPRAHAITRWVAADADPAWEPDVTAFEPPGPGLLLLVSDGLWNYTPEPADLVAAIGDAGDSDEGADRLDLARQLVAFANEAGGSDNITVVLVDLPVPPPPGPPPTVPEGAA
jgi:serine/threonine protein phosphatase PrpC